jgi:hypothetical protein
MGSKITELKALVAFGLSLGMAIDKSLADDGKITFTDAGNLIAPIMKAPAAFSGAAQALAELKALSDEDRAELNAYVKSEFSIHDQHVEAVVEECVNMGTSAARVLALLKKPAAPAPDAPTA